jgi:hypothetical protein
LSSVVVVVAVVTLPEASEVRARLVPRFAVVMVEAHPMIAA